MLFRHCSIPMSILYHFCACIPKQVLNYAVIYTTTLYKAPLALFLPLAVVGVSVTGTPTVTICDTPPKLPSLCSLWSSTKLSTSNPNCGYSKHIARNSSSASWRKTWDLVAQNVAMGLRMVVSVGEVVL